MARMLNRSYNTRSRLSDRDMLLDLMLSEKYLSHFYDHAVTEASDSAIRDTFSIFQQDTQEIARSIYNTMQERGWYNTEQQSRHDRQSTRRPITEKISTATDSSYAVKSGTSNLGERLRAHKPYSKSGIFSNHPQSWQQ